MAAEFGPPTQDGVQRAQRGSTQGLNLPPLPPTPTTVDRAATYWLAKIQNGTPDEQTEARTQLGLLYERSGRLQEATDLFHANVVARAKDRLPYERLAHIARQHGDHSYADRIISLAPAAPPETHPQRSPDGDERAALGRRDGAFSRM